MKKIKISGTEEYLYYKKLKNGLDIYIVPNNNQKNFYITFNTKFGSCNTEFKLDNEVNYHKVPNGVAHYLEHLMFNMEDGSAFDYFSKLGASVNAFTTYNLTCYEVFSSTYFKENLNYLLDYVQTPYFTKKLVDNERGIITEEINMYKNNPNTELTFKTYENIFVNDKRKNLISGEINDIKDITVDDIITCYNTFYNPSNMFIVITGNVLPYEALAIIEENQNNKTFKRVTIKNKVINEVQKVYKEYYEKEMNVEINKISISYKIPKKIFKNAKLNDEELYIYIELLFEIMFGVTSDIEESLISNKVIPEGININKTNTKDYLIVSLMTDTKYKDTLLNMIEERVNNIEVKKDEFDRKIKVLKSNYILHFDDIESVNNNIQDNIIEYNKFIHVMDIYKSLNYNKMISIINNIKLQNKSITVIKPRTMK